MLGRVEPGVAIGVGLIVVAAVVFVIATRRGRALDRSLATIERLQAEASERDRVASQRSAEDVALREGLDAGVVRLDGTLRVREANPRAHLLLGHAAGGLPDRSVMEAFMDPAVEALARRALETGSSAG